MTRFWTAGAEFGSASLNVDGSGRSADDLAFLTGVTVDVATVRSGAGSFKCLTPGGNLGAYLGPPFEPTDGYYRFYARFPSFPAATRAVVFKSGSIISSAGNISTALVELRISSGGVLGLYVLNGSELALSLVGGTTTLSANTWYRIELHVQVGYGVAECRVNGTTLGSTTPTWEGANAGYSPSYALFGLIGLWNYVGQANATLPSGEIVYLDDFAANTTSGSAQNSWPGEGKVIVLKPVADSARSAGMLAGLLGTTNLWDAVNNVPPVGVALASSTATSQVTDIVGNTTDNYDAEVTDYTTAGLATGDSVTLVQPRAVIGRSTSTYGAIAAIKAVSNPADSGETTYFTNATAGSYPTGWYHHNAAAIVYAPTVTKGTRPVVRFGKRVATTDAAMCCGLGLLVEYVEGGGGGTTYTKTVTDPVGVTDSRTQVLAQTKTATDPVGLTDVRTRVEASARTQTDPAGVTDSRTPSLTYARSRTDAVGESDAMGVGGNRSATFTEPMVVFDVRTQRATLSRTPTDPVVGTDTSARVAAFLRSLVEGVAAADSVARVLAYQRPLADLVGGTDSTVPAVTVFATLIDDLAATDDASAVSAAIRVVTDAVDLLDDALGVQAVSRTLTDDAGLTDAPSQMAALARSIDDTLSLIDSIIEYSTVARLLVDPVALSDALARFLQHPTPGNAVGAIVEIGRAVGSIEG